MRPLNDSPRKGRGSSRSVVVWGQEEDVCCRGERDQRARIMPRMSARTSPIGPEPSNFDLPELQHPAALSTATHPTGILSTHTMAGNPREQWERLQVILQNRARRAGGGGAFRFGMPGGGGAPAAALAVLMLGGYALSQSLFNGRHFLSVDLGVLMLMQCSRRWSPRHQVLQNQWCEEGDIQRRYAEPS